MASLCAPLANLVVEPSLPARAENGPAALAPPPGPPCLPDFWNFGAAGGMWPLAPRGPFLPLWNRSAAPAGTPRPRLPELPPPGAPALRAAEFVAGWARGAEWLGGRPAPRMRFAVETPARTLEEVVDADWRPGSQGGGIRALVRRILGK